LRRVVELRFFAGLTEREVAELLGCSARTIERDWLKARLFLLRHLERGDAL
jgi:RNA polymerase sigma factor (sigma-70 family)